MKNILLFISIMAVLPMVSFATPANTAVTAARDAVTRTAVRRTMGQVSPAAAPRYNSASPEALMRGMGVGLVGPAVVAEDYVVGFGLEFTDSQGNRVDTSDINSINWNMFNQIKSLGQNPMTLAFIENFPQLEDGISTRLPGNVAANKVEDALGAAVFLSQREEWDPETQGQLRAMLAQYADPSAKVSEEEMSELVTNCVMPASGGGPSFASSVSQ